MAIKSLQHSSLTDNIFYRSLLAGNAAFEPSDEDILAEQVLSSSAASVTFSGLDAYAADYQHLQIRAVIAGSSSYETLTRMRFNSSATGYAYHYLVGVPGSGVFSSAFSSQDGIYSYYMDTGGNSPAFGAAIIDILDPFETSKNTTLRMLSGRHVTANQRIALTSGLWNNTAAVSSFEIAASSGTYAIGSTFTLIGVK